MGKGFGINTPLTHEVGGKIAQAANDDFFFTTYLYYNLHGPFYMGMPSVLDDPMSQFATNFTSAYSDLLTQRQHIGKALQNAATDAEMTDLTIAKGYHTLSPRDAAPS